jgi:hypothetical protein
VIEAYEQRFLKGILPLFLHYEEEHRSSLRFPFFEQNFLTRIPSTIPLLERRLIESSYFGWRIRNEVATAQFHETEASFSSWQQAFIGLETGKTG